VFNLPAVFVVFVGPAGSGKSSLVASYTKWLRENLLLRVAPVNLDPGADVLKYKPLFDIRSFFTIRDIMDKYGLGPNGAFIKASELIAERVNEILSNEPFSDPSRWDLVLIDTPGQMEAFLFRPSSSIFLKALRKLSNTVIAYIIDASAVARVTDAVFLWFLYVLIQVKTGLISVPVVNKKDIAVNPQLLKYLVEDPLKLAESVSGEGLASEIIPSLVEIAVRTRGPLRAVMVSALSGENMSDLHALIHEAFCACGDLT